MCRQYVHNDHDTTEPNICIYYDSIITVYQWEGALITTAQGYKA
jgi:hypothetical protein